MMTDFAEKSRPDDRKGKARFETILLLCWNSFWQPASVKIATNRLLGVVILAAGRSRRMGKPKMLLPWGKTSVLGHLIAQWSGLDARQIAVVCAHDDSAIAFELDRLGFSVNQRIMNPAPERGMFSSIQCAAQWQSWQTDLTHWAVVLGDQPHLREDTLRRLLEFSEAHQREICQPVWNGRQRHPVVLPRVAFGNLATSKARDLKEFLENFAITGCELEDEGLGLDVDRPEDYEKAKLRASILKPQ
jgi:molybdenum cofactor cytidylyltransferase